MAKLFRYFLAGLVFLVPIAVTVYALWAAFSAVDGWIDLGIPGLGVVIVVAGVTLLGFLSQLFITAPLLRLIDRAIQRVPFVKLLYGAIRDLLAAVAGDKKRFDRPVLVQVGEGIEVLGFITRDDLDAMGVEGRMAVYLPQSYNFAGQTIVVRQEQVTPLDVSPADAMTFALSAGIAKNT
jgi:uncharacterized membrane protein